MKQFFLGIDDTDIVGSRGTGFLSRRLAAEIERLELGLVSGITRHQLYVHREIPYTSQNSSACLAVLTKEIGFLTDFVADFLKKNCPEGSDPGMCLMPGNVKHEEIIDFGVKAKNMVLTMDHAYRIAKKHGIFLRGFLGTKQGIIGALAATGLRISGNDGRFIWLKGIRELRELTSKVFNVSELKDLLSLDIIGSLDDTIANDNNKILGSNWIRPVLKNNKILLLAEQTNESENYEWKVADKYFVRKHS